MTGRPEHTRVAVIGDIGGHVDALRTELRRLGAEPHTGALPTDLVVIQVGDLVHRGPDSEAVIDLVDHYLTEQPDRWVQLVGNHEMHYLRDPAFYWDERVADTAAAVLRRWWQTGAMRVAAAFRTRQAPYLVTHAGLTAGMWRSVLNTPIGAPAAALGLNRLIGRRDGVLARPGVMLTGRRVSESAGPLWADAGRELIPSWLQTPMPFSQIHGHSSLHDWSRGSYRVGDEVAEITELEPEIRHETTTLPGGGTIIGIDPCLGVTDNGRLRAWEGVLLGPVVH